MQKVYHLSHTDLDGYGCQYFSTKVFQDITCFNANYGAEVSDKLEEILYLIKKNILIQKDVLILITDLNLTMKDSNWISKEATKLGAKLQLLDHHITGKACSENFEWYYLDSTRSATKITYDYLQKNHGFDSENRYSQIVKAINAVDIWLSEDELFEFGKVCLGMVSRSNEINRILFETNDRDYKLTLIEKAQNYIQKENGHIILDNELHTLRKAFLNTDNTQDDTKDNLSAIYISNLLTQQKERLTIKYKGHKGILGFNLGNTSILGNKFLVQNPDYDFFMDLNSRGTFSLRSADRLDVSKMAQDIAGGGGHKNASGGKIDGFRESFIYADIKEFVEDFINKKR